MEADADIRDCCFEFVFTRTAVIFVGSDDIDAERFPDCEFACE